MNPCLTCPDAKLPTKHHSSFTCGRGITHKTSKFYDAAKCPEGFFQELTHKEQSQLFKALHRSNAKGLKK